MCMPSQISTFRFGAFMVPRVIRAQEVESRYRYYNQLVDKDVATSGGKGASKQHFDEEKMRLDLGRVGTLRKQVRQSEYFSVRSCCHEQLWTIVLMFGEGREARSSKAACVCA